MHRTEGDPLHQDSTNKAKDIPPIQGGLEQHEFWWRDHFQWLKEHGYLLRPRYEPDWVPSWQNTTKFWLGCEDGQAPMFSHLLDATRISDNSFVTLKVIETQIHPFEAEIGTYFSSEALANEPENHCVPVYETLQVPEESNKVILVMPLLRPFDDPPFNTFGEVVECFRQLFEGLAFMHKHRVAHRDCMDLNIMMDARHLYIDAYHPLTLFMKRDFKGAARYHTRTQRPPKYSFIDFGISCRYEDNNVEPLEVPIRGGDKTVPEFQHPNEPQNPFYTDVYYIGNVIREHFIQTKLGFEFMLPLVNDMVQDDPTKRPSMSEVVIRFGDICKELSSWKLRSRVIMKGDGNISRFFGGLIHWMRSISFMIRRIPPVPTH